MVEDYDFEDYELKVSTYSEYESCCTFREPVQVNAKDRDGSMNEIVLRTNKGEYKPGDVIFGAVYLNIINPTGGRGVKLKFRGYEQFSYEYIKGALKEVPPHRVHKDYIDCPDIKLYEIQEPLTLGCYVFPFRVQLKTELPGTFYTSDQTDVRWEVEVKYWLEAEVIDAAMQNSQGIILLQPPPRHCIVGPTPQAVDVSFQIRRFLFFTRRMHVTARLHDHVYETGGTAKLRVIITNDTGVSISSLTIQLVRDLLLMSKTGVLGSRDDERITKTDDRVFIQPEAGPVVVWEQEIHNSQQHVFHSGLDRILVPLKCSRTNSSLPPSVRGTHVKCDYSIDIVVKLENGNSFKVQVPVSTITAKKNQEWLAWRPLEWLSDTEVMVGTSSFSVSGSALRNEAFFGMPGFQTI